MGDLREKGGGRLGRRQFFCHGQKRRAVKTTPQSCIPSLRYSLIATYLSNVVDFNLLHYASGISVGNVPFEQIETGTMRRCLPVTQEGLAVASIARDVYITSRATSRAKNAQKLDKFRV